MAPLSKVKLQYTLPFKVMGIDFTRALYIRQDNTETKAFGTNHPQLEWHTRVTHMFKSKKHAWHQTMRVHACKINAPHTRIYPDQVSATKRSSLQPVVP